MTSPVKRAPGFTPLKNYLLEVIYRSDFSSRELRVILALARQTYGWQEEGKGKRRRDRVAISFAQASADIGMDLRHFRRTMKDLIARGIVLCYQPGSAWSPGVYGLESNTEKWATSGAKTAPKDGGPNQPPIIGGQNVQSLGAESALNKCQFLPPKIASQPSADKASRGPKESIKEIKNIDTGLGLGVNFEETYDIIETPQQALTRQDWPLPQVMASGEKIYFRKYGRSFSTLERATLADFFSLSPNRGSLLAIWLRAIDEAHRDRAERKRQPELARYVSKVPFKDVHHFAAERYESQKAAQEARTGQQGGRLTG